ncbi:hypothetical protein R3X25_11725 [Lutibacter sp. TH_r2]|uniref:hypothetical protein n=1 Tax=Lutibacter sp. TH_r2 TaxID=3082083 RepID=UPI002952A47F|nr:hypothetical protein [Lutibacter sp. TH_r2]MDV7187952.1 hypothetical protein [Lutibacter sp. TH_r2]
MPINHIFRKSIDQLKSSQTNYFLKYESILKWHKENTNLYNKSINNYSCSIHEPKLPCFCEKRKVDCLFIDIYKELSKLIEKENIFKKTVLEFNSLKNDTTKILNWKNENKRINFNTYINEKGLIIRLNASKKNDTYLEFIMRIKKEELIFHKQLNEIFQTI